MTAPVRHAIGAPLRAAQGRSLGAAAPVPEAGAA